MFLYYMLIAVFYVVYHTGAYTTKQTKDKYTGEKYKYYHFIKDMNIIQEPRQLHHILNSVFANLAMKCLVTPTPCEASTATMWLSDLRTLPNLHFDHADQGNGDDTSLLDIDIGSLNLGDPALPQPDDAVLQAVPELTYWLAFDVETHDLAPAVTCKGWIQGRFGHQCRCKPAVLENLRMVQLGWCMRMPPSSDMVEKKYYITPDAFEVTKPAEAMHHITDADLRKSGRPLRDVLAEFMLDVVRMVECGGAICAHHLEFDAGIVAFELQRIGLFDNLAIWEQSVQQGFCTMNPIVSRWSCEIYFDVAAAQSQHGRARPVGICNMMLALLPNDCDAILTHHDAGADAHMVWKLVGELQRRLKQYRGTART